MTPTTMDEKIKRVYVPMTETGFYILYCLQEENYVNYEFVIAKLHDSNSELYIFINNLEGDYIQFSKVNFVYDMLLIKTRIYGYNNYRIAYTLYGNIAGSSHSVFAPR